MPFGKDNNNTPTNSEKEESSNTKTIQHNPSIILSMTKPYEHKGAIPVVHIKVK